MWRCALALQSHARAISPLTAWALMCASRMAQSAARPPLTPSASSLVRIRQSDLNESSHTHQSHLAHAVYMQCSPPTELMRRVYCCLSHFRGAVAAPAGYDGSVGSQLVAVPAAGPVRALTGEWCLSPGRYAAALPPPPPPPPSLPASPAAILAESVGGGITFVAASSAPGPTGRLGPANTPGGRAAPKRSLFWPPPPPPPPPPPACHTPPSAAATCLACISIRP